MSWAEFQPVPGTDWANPKLKPTVRTFNVALVLGDYSDEPFAVTQPAGSTIFGNPTKQAYDIPRSDVAKFYKDFLNKPEELNHYRTVNAYWMEDSDGRYGVHMDAYGPYRLPGKSYEYGLNSFSERSACPSGADCTRDFRTDLGKLWRADVGAKVADSYDSVFYLSAGEGESTTWQEFGEMLFQAKEDVSNAWGPPDPSLPNWAPTRYVPWTSWKAAAGLWANTRGHNPRTTIESESSGQGTYEHEMSHVLGIGDNYNNPYGHPLRRSYTGPWEMLSRGSFNGPGGPHTRWLIPPTEGGSLGSQHMLRDKMALGIINQDNVLHLSRATLARSGIVVARVTAREADPGRAGLSGINVAMPGGDQEPSCDVSTDYRCDGGGYDNYTAEVVQRIGDDSFTPDSGVLLAKTKNFPSREPFEWVIDTHPNDIGLVDYYEPGTGKPVMMSLGDYRQLDDALFHAGTHSGSKFEYVDKANRLHFYIVDVHHHDQGLLSYTIAVRSLDGAGPQQRGVAVSRGSVHGVKPAWAARCTFPLTNTGSASPEQPGWPAAKYLDSDVYRLSVSSSGHGWRAQLYSDLATARFGHTVEVPVYVTRVPGSASRTTVTLTATSVSNASKTATATCRVHVKDTTH